MSLFAVQYWMCSSDSLVGRVLDWESKLIEAWVRSSRKALPKNFCKNTINQNGGQNGGIEPMSAQHWEELSHWLKLKLHGIYIEWAICVKLWSVVCWSRWQNALMLNSIPVFSETAAKIKKITLGNNFRVMPRPQRFDKLFWIIFYRWSRISGRKKKIVCTDFEISRFSRKFGVFCGFRDIK